MVVLVTYYCLVGLMYNGHPVHPGAVAVDPRVIPLGSHILTKGGRDLVAEDTGRWIHGNHIDIWTPDCRAAKEWGAHHLDVQVLRPPVHQRR